MRVFTGLSCLLEPAMIEVIRASMDKPVDAHIVVVPKQLTLQTERTLLKALDLKGSFQLQVLSPERLCQHIFDAAGLPDGVRVDERGRVMLVRQAIRDSADALKLYRGAEHRRGFPDRCARQLELLRQAGLTPGDVRACAEKADGLLAMKLGDLAAILEAYEALLSGRFQDSEAEFGDAAERVSGAAFLRSADVTFFGFDLTPPTLHRLIAAVGGVCDDVRVFLPLENDESARDIDVYAPLDACFSRLLRCCAQAGVAVERVYILPASDRPARPGTFPVPMPAQKGDLSLLARELYAYPARPADAAPRHIQLAAMRNPMEECLFAAALCRRLAMKQGWRWNDFMILCRDVEAYHQPLRDAFRAYGVPIFLSSDRPAARHALAECVLTALRLTEPRPAVEDAVAILHTGFMPVTGDEADRLETHIVRYGLRPYALLKPLKRGTEAELQALEPVRARYAAPLNALKGRLRRAKALKDQLTAVFGFLEDVDAFGALQARLNALVEADLREAAGEESQVWNRLVGALDQMAALMGEQPLEAAELRETLSESLEAAAIKPLPQSDDAVYAQATDRIVARRVKALLLLGETDRVGTDPDGLFNAAQTREVSRLADAYLGPDDAEISMTRRFYLKSAVEMASDYLCVSWPMSGMDDSAQHPGALVDLLQELFPALKVRGGVTGDDSVSWMLRAAPRAAMAHAARALSARVEGVPMEAADTAALAGLWKLAGNAPEFQRAFDRFRAALDHADAAERLSPETARALYGDLRRQSVTRLERYAQCPFSYFAQYGLRPERVEPFELNVRDEGTFFHDAVREFLARSMDDLSRLSIPEAEARMDAVSDDLLDQMARQGPLGQSAVALAERRRLKATARTCAGVLAEHMHNSRFAPAALETDFGREDGPARLVVDASSGQCVLEGRIDRVDTWPEGGYLRVIDYKRGGRTLDLDAVYHGLSLQLPVYLAAAMKKRGGLSAGVYYFNLDEGILTLQTTDKNAVERERRSSFRMTGLAIDDTEVLAAQSPNFPEVLNLRVNQSGGLYKDAQATDAKGFEALTAHVLRKSAALLDEIRGGNAAIAPIEFRKKSPCANCDLRPGCLIDPRLDAERRRRFKTMKGNEALERMKLEEQ